MSQRKCEWIFLPAHDDKIKCGAPVIAESQYCAEHQQEMDYILSLDDNWKEIEATQKAVCDEPTESKGEEDKGRKR